MARERVCRPLGSCRDERVVDGVEWWQCRVCGTEFPCSGKCTHLDCAVVRGDKVLPWGAVDLDPSLPMAPEYATTKEKE